MLTGKELAKAIEVAIHKKRALDGSTQADLARHFNVRPSSVTGWVQDGRIGKDRITGLVEYFAGVVGPEHFGLPASSGAGAAVAVGATTQEKLLLELFRAAPEELRKGVLVALLMGEAPQGATTAAPIDQQRFGALQASVAEFYAAKSDEEKTKIKLDLGGQVLQMIDLRTRDRGPPPDIPDRRAAQAKQ